MLNRPYAFLEWLRLVSIPEVGEQQLSGHGCSCASFGTGCDGGAVPHAPVAMCVTHPQKFIVMCEADHLFLRPMPNFMNGEGQGAALFTYIVPWNYNAIVKKFIGPVSWLLTWASSANRWRCEERGVKSRWRQRTSEPSVQGCCASCSCSILFA